MASFKYPKKVVLGDITVRDGFQHEEKFIPTDAKLWVAEELILAGFKRLEVTNFGNPKVMPQFKDADDLSKRLHTSKKVGHLLKDVEITAITIREKAVERTIQACKEGVWSGPDSVYGLHQRIPSQDQLRAFTPRVLEDVRNVYSKSPRCRNESLRDREHHLGLPHRGPHGNEKSR